MPDTIPCRLCGCTAENAQQGKLLSHVVNYFACGTCGYFQTEDPFWLEQAYAEPINRSDTGIVARNLSNCRITLVTLAILGGLHHKVIDYAGGYGLLVRLLRDAGVDARWRDPYTPNLLARGYEAEGGTEPASTVITAFEVLEHLVNPLDEIARMAESADAILCSTTLLPSEPPVSADWWYLGGEHGQHIGFFSPQSLAYTARELGLHLVSNGRDYHLLSRTPVNKLLWRAGVRAHRFLAPLVALPLPSLMWPDHIEQSEGKTHH